MLLVKKVILEPCNTTRRIKKRLLPEDFCTVIIVLHGVLHKAKAVDVADIRMSIGTQ